MLKELVSGLAIVYTHREHFNIRSELSQVRDLPRLVAVGYSVPEAKKKSDNAKTLSVGVIILLFVMLV